MDFFNFVRFYSRWHYSQGLLEILHLEKKFLISVGNSFSMKTIIRTFFSPWKRVKDGYKKGHPEEWFGSFIFNTIMRLLGIVIRTFVILFGVLALLAGLLFSVLLILGWVFLPIILLGLFILGIIELRS